MSLVTVERLLVIQKAFHEAWKLDLDPFKAATFVADAGITPQEVMFYAEWAATQPNNDLPE
jgi:hypothetical protein